MRAMHLVAAAALLAIPARADDTAKQDPKIKFERYTLDNGLEVILAPDPSVPLVAVNLWYHVGSGYEVPGKSGFAHLFEHMLFQGSKNVGEDKHFEILKKIGGDQINGTTNTDRTNYFELVPSNQLETALWLESDRMSHLLEMLNQQSLTNQIDVVRNERRQSYENQPYGKARIALYEALYPEGHPYKHTTIGLADDLQAATVDDVKSFFKTWYVPANATITLSGDFDPADAKAKIEKWFGSFPKSEKPKVVAISAPPIASKKIEMTDDFAKLRQITWAWHSPARFAADDAELDVAAEALAREGTGRLYRVLVHDKQLAQVVRASQGGMGFSGIFTITVQLRTGADAQEVERIVTDEVAKLRGENLSDREVARVVTEGESAAIYQLESLMQRAQVLQTYNHYLGNPDSITWDLDRYRHTTPDKIRAAVNKWLTPDHVIEMVVSPKGGAS
ncbi:MAG TPA: pitrilysin family protein [Kofleriaceae bacterium]|nr:pitrilysin family protein [Kofleriaceae bacterium]